jgi:excisionase family DNA binding protein
MSPQSLNPNEQVGERLLTVTEVAKRLRVDVTTVRRYITGGSLQAIMLPHRGRRKMYRIKESTLDTILHPKGRTP